MRSAAVTGLRWRASSRRRARPCSSSASATTRRARSPTPWRHARRFNAATSNGHATTSRGRRGSRPLLTYGRPTYSVRTLLEVARTYLALEDTAGAREVLRQARDILQKRPDLGVLPEEVDRARVEARRRCERERSERRR